MRGGRGGVERRRRRRCSAPNMDDVGRAPPSRPVHGMCGPEGAAGRGFEGTHAVWHGGASCATVCVRGTTGRAHCCSTAVCDWWAPRVRRHSPRAQPTRAHRSRRRLVLGGLPGGGRGREGGGRDGRSVACVDGGTFGEGREESRMPVRLVRWPQGETCATNIADTQCKVHHGSRQPAAGSRCGTVSTRPARPLASAGTSTYSTFVGHCLPTTAAALQDTTARASRDAAPVDSASWP